MYTLRVNSRTKRLVEEIAAAVDLPVSEIVRRAKAKMDKGKLRLLDQETVAVQQRDENVINISVCENYHAQLKETITAEIPPFADKRVAKMFRTCLIAACLDSKAKGEVRNQRIKELNSFYKNYQSQLIAERRALFEGLV